MNRLPGWAIAVAVLVPVFFIVLIVGGMWISYSNTEIRLRKTIEAKQIDNKNEYDAMWKKIAQTAEVTDEHKKALREIFEGYATARGGIGEDGTLMKWLHEAVPNVDLKTYENLQNIIVASRDSFVMRQKELLDLKREHDIALNTFPSSMFVGSRPPIDVVIITSTKTEKAFNTGKDDETKVFQK